MTPSKAREEQQPHLPEPPVDGLPFFPYRFMAVDVGSNSIKYRIWQIEEDGSMRPIAEERFPVRLGGKVFTTGLLPDEGIEGAVETFTRIKAAFESNRVHSLRAVATSATREASNGLTLVRKVLRETGIALEILPAAEEARMIALGALGARPSLQGEYLLIDIGGGSTEVILARDPDIVAAQSIRLGAVRLREMFFTTQPPAAEQVQLAEEHIQDVINKALHIPKLETRAQGLGSAGTITAVAQMTARLPGGALPDGGVSLAQVEELLERVRTLSADQIADQFGLDLRRAEIILGGLLVLRAVLRHLGLDSLQLVRGGVSDGLLQVFLERAGLRRSRLFDHDRSFLLQAMALGDHYQFHRAHGEQVSRLAVSLFEQLEPLHELGPSDRTLLKGAALLHEIGQFVGFAAHHKHSYYLIMHSDLPGISETEKMILACVARYHRKGHPKARHDGYAELDPASRERVRKLAALLRIADGLDREQQSLVTQVQARVTPKAVEFHIAVHYRAAIEVWNAREKASLFEEVFRRKTEFYVVKI